MAPKVLSLDPAVFDPASIPKERLALNRKLVQLSNTGPMWYEVGAPVYRKLRAEGKTVFPKPTFLPHAEEHATLIPSRDTERTIPCRVIRPQPSSATDSAPAVKGVFMHIHGGGWVLSDHKSYDPFLTTISNDTGLVAVSVGYRLAPENPYPAGTNDVYDAAEWLVENAEKEFGGRLMFVGGESAGGHLSMLVALHLLTHESSRFRDFGFKGLLLHYGCYDMDFTPRVYEFQPIIAPPFSAEEEKDFTNAKALVLSHTIMKQFRSAFVPESDSNPLLLRNPRLSPLYWPLEALRGRLPPALFTCGTQDILLDDSLFMASRWVAAGGGEAQLEIFPGAVHGYITLPENLPAASAEGLAVTKTFIRSKMSG